MIPILALTTSLAIGGPSAPPAPAGPPPPAGPSASSAGPLTMEAAVALALRQNPALEAARRERNVGRIEAERARPAFRPEVTATASQVLRAPRVELPGRRDDVVLPNSLSRFEIALRQPLHQFGAGRAPARRAEAMAEAAESEFRIAELDTALEAREAYLALLRAEAMREVAARGVELAAEHLRVTRLLQERGLQAEVDVLEAERALAEAEAGRVQAENGVALARANLNRVLGRPLATPVRAEAGPLPAEAGPLEALVERARAQRPELALLRHNIAAAEAGVQLARAARRPRVTLDAAYALQTPTALTPEQGISAGLSLTIPIFEGAAQRLTVEEAEERLAQLRSALAAREQGIALEVERQRLAMAEAQARIALAERAVAAAERAYEITRLRLERGRAVQVEVLNARLALQRALADRAAAENDLRLAEARLARALGEGLPAGEAPQRGEPAAPPNTEN